MLVKLKMNQGAQMKLWCDNKPTISIANKPVQHDRTKHMEIGRFFIKKKLYSELLELGHVATRQQEVDCLTKGLSSLDLIRLCDKMAQWISYAHLKGSVGICIYFRDLSMNSNIEEV
jgi:hypothetical protein